MFFLLLFQYECSYHNTVPFTIHPLYCDHEWHFTHKTIGRRCIVVALLHDILLNRFAHVLFRDLFEEKQPSVNLKTLHAHSKTETHSGIRGSKRKWMNVTQRWKKYEIFWSTVKVQIWKQQCNKVKASDYNCF